MQGSETSGEVLTNVSRIFGLTCLCIQSILRDKVLSRRPKRKNHAYLSGKSDTHRQGMPHSLCMQGSETSGEVLTNVSHIFGLTCLCS